MVNNAGIAVVKDGLKLTHEESDDTWHRTMLINSTGVFYGCRAAIKQMMKQDLHPSGDRYGIVAGWIFTRSQLTPCGRGWIVNTASMLGLVGFAGASM